MSCVVVALRADSVEFGAASALTVIVLGPVALACAFRVAARIGGLALGDWTLLVWILLPWLAPAFTLAKYDETMRDDVLPLVLGLTGDAGYAEGVAILVALTLLIERTRLATAVAALILMTVIVVLGSTATVGGLSLEALQTNMAGLREYFWSQRLLQWLPVAGGIAVARRSPLLAGALCGWLGAFVCVRLATSDAAFDDGEFFRLLLPALPAYVLLAAAVPLLVPTLAARLGPLARPA
jgi:hypothetical protein